MGYFDLEKKTDGLYRCRGGWLADVLLFSGGIIYLLLSCILQPIIWVFRKILGI